MKAFCTKVSYNQRSQAAKMITENWNTCHVIVATAINIKANSSNEDKRFYILLSVFHQVNITYSPLTDYICSRVKGGPSTRIYLCKRLPNYQSWFSTSLNFLIGLPFWLPLITRFHIPLMIGGREARECAHTHTHLQYTSR